MSPAAIGARERGYQKALDIHTSITMLPDAVQVSDPVHVARLANIALDECRRRVLDELFGHSGRKDDPLYRARRLLVMAAERLTIEAWNAFVGYSPLVTRHARFGSHGRR